MKARKLKVYYHHPDRPSRPPHRQHLPVPEPMPYLRLCGRWMEQAGFQIGDRVHVAVERGRLIVTTEEDR